MLFVIVSWISFIIDPQVEQSLNLIVIIKFHFGKVGTWKNVIIDYPVSCHYQHLQFSKVRLKQKFENPNFLFIPMIFFRENAPSSSSNSLNSIESYSIFCIFCIFSAIIEYAIILTILALRSQINF